MELARTSRTRVAWHATLEATRRSLVTRLKDHGDNEGWQRFFDTYGGAIHGLCLKAGLGSAEADDALQETLVSVMKEMPGFRYDPAKGSFKGWLIQIARRRVVDQFRRRARATRTGENAVEVPEEVPDAGSDPLSRVWEEEWRINRLTLAVEQVKPKVAPRQWQMFDLATLKQWPTERVCATLGINRAQLYMARMRVGHLLRAELERLRREEQAD